MEGVSPVSGDVALENRMIPVSRRLLLVFALMAVLLSCAATVRGWDAASDPGPPTIDVSLSGRIQISPEGFLEERLLVPEAVSDHLMKMRMRENARLNGWPVSPGDRRTVHLTRVSVYAAGASILEIGDQGVRTVARSKHRYFVGAIEDEEGTGVLVILDPANRALKGLSVSEGSTYDLAPLGNGNPSEVRVVATHEKMAAFDPHWACGEETIAKLPFLADERDDMRKNAPVKSGGMLEAVVAIDTDTELMSQKFGGSTSAATDYIADLIAAMNVMYARDLGVTLVQGTTYLRTSSDPYSVNSGGAASSAELYEFRTYWANNHGSVQRALVAMLSGKSIYPNSASGIAWVGSLCSTSTGYSFSKVFKINYLSGDAGLVGHEIGHNFGSPHTHCYSPPIDYCWNDCGGIQTTSCPGGPGTVMSYCHLRGCGNNLLQFHSRVIDNIVDNHVGPATGLCVFEATSGDDLFTDGFEAGGTGAWTSAVP
jgi:hypothetical protein